jgi:hypothetical protein
VKLFKAASKTSPFFGFGTSWAATLEHARHYTRTPPFGGSVLYAVTVDVKPFEVYDLTGDPVTKLKTRGFDLYSQGEGEWLPGEIIRLGKQLGSTWGHCWWTFDVNEPGGGTTWLYLGQESLPAREVS